MAPPSECTCPLVLCDSVTKGALRTGEQLMGWPQKHKERLRISLWRLELTKDVIMRYWSFLADLSMPSLLLLISTGQVSLLGSLCFCSTCSECDSVHALAAMGSLYSVSNKRQGLLQTSLLICFKKSFLYSSSCLHDKPGLDDDHKILVFIDNSAYSSWNSLQTRPSCHAPYSKWNFIVSPLAED